MARAADPRVPAHRTGPRGVHLAVVIDRDVPAAAAVATVTARLADEFTPERVRVVCLTPPAWPVVLGLDHWPLGYVDEAMGWSTVAGVAGMAAGADRGDPPGVVMHLRRLGLEASGIWSSVGWRATLRLVGRVGEGTDLLLAVTDRRRLLPPSLGSIPRVEALRPRRPAAVGN